MRKHNLRIISFLMLCVMIVSLATACASDTSGDNDTTSGSNNDPGSSSTGDSQESNSGEDTLPLTEITLPIAENEEITVWMQWSNDYISSPNDIPSIQKKEEITGVHVNWITCSQAECPEKYTLLLASSELPDLVYTIDTTTYPGGYVKGIDDGVFMDLTDIVNNYMPNYRRLLESDPEFLRAAKSDDGRFVGIYEIECDAEKNLSPEPPWGGMAVRRDWLDKLSLEIPVTIDDWHNVLVAFRDNIEGCTAPMMIGANGKNRYGAWTSAFGVGDDWYLKDETTVGFGPLEDGYKEWLKLFAQWYSEGLIDPNFISNDSWFTAPIENIATGQAGAFPTIQGFCGTSLLDNGQATDPDFFVTATQAPRVNADDIVEYSEINDTVCYMAQIASTSEKAEIIAQWLDYNFTDEGFLLGQFGIEGDTYEIVNGVPQFTEKITNNPDGYSPAEAKAIYCSLSHFPGLFNWQGMQLGASEVKLAASYDIWKLDGTAMVIPSSVAIRAEDTMDYNNKYTQISTYVDEMTVKFIMGTEDVDAKWDEFVSTILSLGIEDCIGYWQVAYEAYLNR